MVKYISLKEFKKDPKKFDEFEISLFCFRQKMSEQFMWEMRDYLNWHSICNNKHINLSQEFIDKAKDYVDWDSITWKFGDKWDEDFIRQFKDYITWDNLVIRKKISEEFAIEMFDYIPFEELLTRQIKNYSEQFLRTVFLYNPRIINNVLNLTEFNFSLDFIREIKNYFNANVLIHSTNIPQTNRIIDEFKFDFGKKIWYTFLKEKDIDMKLLVRFKENIDWDNTYFTEWYIEAQDDKDYEAIEQLREYMGWLRLKNGFSRNSSKAIC